MTYNTKTSPVQFQLIALTTKWGKVLGGVYLFKTLYLIKGPMNVHVDKHNETVCEIVQEPFIALV